MGILIGGLVIAVLVVVFILQPIVAQQWAATGLDQEEPTEAQARKRIALLALRDAEYDFATGKLDEADYASLRNELAEEALEAIEAEQAEQSSQRELAYAEARHPGAAELEELEQEIEAYRAGLRQAIACPFCGNLNELGSRFCADCGTRLPSRRAQESPAPETGKKA